jgi:hypothetical protein
MVAAYPDIPDEADNDVREDGTAAHWLAAEMWHGRTPPVDTLSPNNRVCDEDMFDAVDLYIDGMRRADDAEWYVEQPVSCDAIYPGMRGTPDAWSYRPGLLRVRDFKYGFRYVEVMENWQLICYAVSIAHQLKLPPDTLVELQIVQPRSNHRDGPVRTWTTKLENLYPFAEKLRVAAYFAMQPLPPCTPNPGCVDCPGRHTCVALQASAYTALELSYSSVPLELEPLQVASELSKLKDAEKRLAARISGLEGQAEHMIKDGKVLPGWSLEATYARERYVEGGAESIIGLAPLFGVTVTQPVKPLSPAKVRKLLPAGVLAPFVHKPSTGVKLRKADKFQARKAFSKE